MKLVNLFKQARVVAENSHDKQTQVGALLLNPRTGAVLSSGYNGFIRGAKDDELPNTGPEKYPYMVHAEQNLLLNCARHGVATEGCWVICTLSPCSVCMRMLYQAGITRVFFDDTYRDFDTQKKMKDLNVYQSQDVTGFQRIDISTK